MNNHKLRPLHNLVELCLQRGDRTSWRQPKTHLNRLLQFLDHPRLQRLTIKGVAFASSTEDKLNISHVPRRSTRCIVSLTLTCASIDAAGLRKLIGELESLQTLNLIRQRPNNSDRWSNDDDPHYRFGHLYNALAAASSTLQCLKMLHTNGDVQDEYWSLLPNLNPLYNLKSLIIDLFILIGHRLCPQCQDTTHLKEAGEFASMLPESLERLSVVLDLDPARRMKSLRANFTESLIREKKSGRLARLRHVVFVELVRFQGEPLLECSCQRGANEVRLPRDLDLAKHRRMTYAESIKCMDMKKECEDVGIDLVLIDEDHVDQETLEWAQWLEDFEDDVEWC